MLVNYLRTNWLPVIVQSILMVFVFRILERLLSINSPLMDFVMVLVVTLILVLGGKISEHYLRRKTVSIVDEKFNIPRRGVIFTLGIIRNLGESAQMQVINTLKPEFYGFVTTADIEKNLEVVGKFVNSISIEPSKYRKMEVDPTELLEIKDSVSHMIKWMLKKVDRKDIVVDITGGTAVMSCGAYLAAKEFGVDVQYVYSDYNFSKNCFIPNTKKALIVGDRVIEAAVSQIP